MRVVQVSEDPLTVKVDHLKVLFVYLLYLTLLLNTSPPYLVIFVPGNSI